jgi:hypothetical protein
LLQKAGIGSKNGKQLMADGISWILDWEPGNYKEVRQTFVVSVVNNIYLWRKVVCFVLFVVMRSTELGCFRSCSWCLWKALHKEHGLGFHGVWTCGANVLEYWMISSLKIQLNCSWKFRRNWNVPLVLLERHWRAGFNGIYLVRFGFRMWEILILKWFQPLKIQINSN